MPTKAIVQRLENVSRWLYRATIHQDLDGSIEMIDELKAIQLHIERKREYEW